MSLIPAHDHSSGETNGSTPALPRKHLQSSAGRQSHRQRRQSSICRLGCGIPAGIIGFYLLALLCAVLHLVFFRYLDGRILPEKNDTTPFMSTTIPQSYVTTISFALVNAFRAALIATIGICFTQYLWQSLRSDALEVGVIEGLFQIRANVFRFLDFRLARYAPVLCFIAIISWLLPVAMIYPPGALVVDIIIHQVPSRFNVSVIPSDADLHAVHSPPDPELDGIVHGFDSGFGSLQTANASAQDCSSSSADCNFIGNIGSLNYIANSVLFDGRVAEIDRPGAENASYSMKFRGPILQCKDTIENDTTTWQSNAFRTARNKVTGGELLEHWLQLSSYWTYRMGHSYGNFSIEQPQEDLTWDPCPTYLPGVEELMNEVGNSDTSFNDDNSTAPLVIGNTTLIRTKKVKHCQAATGEYKVNVSFFNGKQNITYSTSDIQAMPKLEYPLQNVDLGPFDSLRDYINVLALAASLTRTFSLMNKKGAVAYINSSSIVPSGFDGPTPETCQSRWKPSSPYLQFESNTDSILPMSVFYPDRADGWTVNYPEDFVFSETLLNEVLANITISALSLNQYYDMVDGFVTRPFRVYHFRHPIPFYVPYGLALLLTIPVMFLGLKAVHQNGVTAIDGGFVQLLMTTTGRTELERVAAKGCLGGKENIPPELLRLKVRFGDLSDAVRAEIVAAAETSSGYSKVQQDAEAEDVHTIEILHDGSVTMGQNEPDVSTSSGSSTSNQHRQSAMRRAGFGLIHETDRLEDSVQYGDSNVRVAKNRGRC